MDEGQYREMLMENDSLKNEFEQEMLELCEREHALGTYSTRFQAMIAKHSALDAAHLLLDPKRDLPPMFEELRRSGLIHLTMEHIVLKPKYQPLFSPNEREIADGRLKYGL